MIRRSGDRVEMVLHRVGRYATSLAVSGQGSCRLDLARFERRWQSARYRLHARSRSRAGSWEIQVTSVHYDAARHVLIAGGRLEDHQVAALAANACGAGSCSTTTEIVYADTFIPFDSSF